MANPEHVEIVKGGTDAIDEWRRDNPDGRLNLLGADLRGVKIGSADLNCANLNGANLRAADMRQTNLHGASLIYAELTVALLESADLRETDLRHAHLTNIIALDTNFEGARFLETALASADLKGARGLESVRHLGPSSIDERTLRTSWPLPEVFLRGVGLSEELIDFARATYGKAIEFYSCFISYSSKDDEFARRLHADLQAEGVRCWFAPEDLKIGDKFRPRIDEAIRLHDKLLLILSENSVDSPWVEDEVESALEKERKAKERGEERVVLFPIRLDAAVMETDAAWAASIRRTRHIGDFSAWKDHDAYQKAFERLLRDLKSEGKEGGNGES